MARGLLTLYLRREPTVDSAWLQYGDGRPRWDVRYYGDPKCQNLKGICPWYYSSKPRRGCRTTVLNCYRWAVVWLPDAPATTNVDKR
jgi:hypothetical protein